MFLSHTLKFIIGYIRVEITGSDISNFFNYLMKENIYIWNVSKINDKFYINTNISSYKSIYKLSKGFNVRFKINNRYGLPFIIYRYRKRIGFLVGFLIFISFLFIMSQFIWTIEVHGSKNIDENQLIKFISSKNIGPGKLKKNIDVKTIERETLLNFKNISWISINILGSKAVIEINERTLPPKNIDSGDPCNIVALKPGIIDHIEAYQGQNVVNIGDFVEKDQLLVNGILEDRSLNNYLVHSRAKAIAKVEEIFCYSQPLSFQKIRYKNFSTNLYLEIFNKKIPINFTKKLDGEVKYQYLKIFPKVLNISLPFNIEKRYNLVPSLNSFYISPDKARNILLHRIDKHKTKMKSENIKILSKQVIKDEIIENIYVIKIKYITLQDIAKPKKIIVD